VSTVSIDSNICALVSNFSNNPLAHAVMKIFSVPNDLVIFVKVHLLYIKTEYIYTGTGYQIIYIITVFRPVKRYKLVISFSKFL
jgi:hypothetical protein